MKKRGIILVLFSVYVIILFIVAAQYELREQNLTAKGFGARLGESLSLLFGYFYIAFVSSSLFLIVSYFIHKKLSFVFIFLAPFLNVMVAFAIGLSLTFILEIFQLDTFFSPFQKTFMTATLSTLAIMLWILGDVFKKETEVMQN